MKKNKNRFLLGFFFGMLAMAVVVGGVGTGLYFANQNTSGKTISEKTSQKLDYINISDIAEEKSGGKYMLDLVTANKLILIHAGIDPNNIDASDICTCCNSRELHSHRASPLKRGNLAAIIALI